MNVSFLRKPLKPVLYSVIFLLLSATSLVFFMQYRLDSLAMQEAVEKYAYVATVYDNRLEAPMVRALPEEMVHQICSADGVTSVEHRRAYSARAEQTDTVPDYFMSDRLLNGYDVVDGLVLADGVLDELTGIESTAVTVWKNWAGVSWKSRVLTAELSFAGGAEPIMLHAGDHVFLIGCNPLFNQFGSPDTTRLCVTVDPQGTPLEKHSVLVIPPELERLDEDAYIEAFLQENGLSELVEQMFECHRIFTVRPVTDMSMLLSVADGSVYVSMGRELSASDIGKNVCVINEFVAHKNGLRVGDTIKLACSNTTYYAPLTVHEGTWETGFPCVDDLPCAYGEYETYEIVGVYNFNLPGRFGDDDFLKFSRNDIFIPVSRTDETQITDAADVLPCQFSFRIPGPDYEQFMDRFEMPLSEAGYVIQTVDTGWEDYSFNYYALAGRRLISLICAILSMLAAVILFVILLRRHFGYEYALRRLMGASKLRSFEAFITGFFLLGLPALLAAAFAVYIVYDSWLSVRMASVIDGKLPGGLSAIGILLRYTGAELAVGIAALLVMLLFISRKNLLRLLK